MAQAPASLVYLTRLVNLQRTAGVGGPDAGPAPVLAFTDQPDGGAPGAQNAVRVSVAGAVDAVLFQLRDAGNEPLGLPTAVVPEGGVADFAFLNPEAGTGYAVSAADVDGRAALALSGRFDVRAPAVVRTLAFTEQPADAQEGAAGRAAVSASNVASVVFRLVDAGGAPMGDPAAVRAEAGTAAWGFTVPPAGEGYRVRAEAAEDAAVRAVSNPFASTPAPADLPSGSFAADGGGAVLLDGDGNLIPA